MADLKDIEISIEVDTLQAQKAFKALTRDQKALEKAHNTGKITIQQYGAATNSLERRQEALTEAVRRGGKAFRMYNNRLNQAKSGSNKFGMVSQQVGYQVGDFFVQVQSGTSALVAFGQQGTQLAGLIPGIGGAIVGIGLAIGTMVLRTRQQMNGAVESLVTYAEAVKKVRNETAKARQENEAFFQGYASVEQKVITEKIEKTEEELRRLKKTLGGFNLTLKDMYSFDSGNKDKSIGRRVMDWVSILGVPDVTKGITQIESRVENLIKEIKRNEQLLQEEIDKILQSRERSRKEAEDKAKAKSQFEGMFAFQEAYFSMKYKGSDLAKQRKGIKEAREAEQSENERLAKVTFERAMAFSEAYDNAFYGEQRKRRLQLIKEAKQAEIKENERLAKLQFDRAMSFSQAYDNALYGKERARRLQLIKQAKEAEIAENERLAKVQFDRAMSFEQAYSNMLFNAKKKQAAKEKSILMGKYSDAYSGRGLADASFAEGSEELRLAQEKIKLLEIENKYGKESKELYNAITQSKLEALIYDQKENDLSETTNKELQKQLVAYRELLLLSKEQDKLNQKREAFEATVSGYLESGFMSMIDGTKSVTDAFRSMARDVIKELYRILVVQQIVNQAKTAIQSLSGYVYNANGNAFNNGKIIPYANGGVVGSPTMFPMSGGKTGLMGEAGPEAILPLKRGPNGKLGVESSGGSVVVNQTINVSTGVAQTVRNEIKTLMPQIAEGAKSAVLDAKRRGGSFGSAFA